MLCYAVFPKCTNFMNLIRLSSHQYGEIPTLLISFLAVFSKGRDLQLSGFTHTRHAAMACEYNFSRGANP